MTGKVSTVIVLFKKRKKKNGKYPAKLRLTHNRKQQYYSIDNKDRVYEFTEDEFSKIISAKPRGVYKDISIEFLIIEEKAQKIIPSFSEFSFDKFKTHFGISGTDLRNIYYFMDIAIKKYSETGRGLSCFFKKGKAIKKTDMKKVRELLHLVIGQGHSSRQAAKIAGMSKSSASEYVSGFKTSGIELDKMSKLTDSELLWAITGPNGKQANERYAHLISLFGYIEKELLRPGVTLQLLWQELFAAREK